MNKLEFDNMKVTKVMYSQQYKDRFVEAMGDSCNIELTFSASSDPSINVGDVLKVRVEYEASN